MVENGWWMMDLVGVVVVMDLVMPYLNGLEASRRIFQEVPTPVVLLSGRDGNGASVTPFSQNAQTMIKPAVRRQLRVPAGRLCLTPQSGVDTPTPEVKVRAIIF